MRSRREDSETRYFIDLDVKTRKVLDWCFDQRDKLVKHERSKSAHVRIYLTGGQFNKLERKEVELSRLRGA